MMDFLESLGDCCPKCHCAAENEDGIIHGGARSLKGEEMETLTTYFHNAFYNQKKIKGEDPAIIFYDKTLTFTELSRASTIMSTYIKELVIIDEKTTKPNADIVFAICLPPSEKVIPVIFAILKTGAAYLALDPDYPQDVVMGITRRFSPKAIITELYGPVIFNADEFPDCKILTVEDLWEKVNLNDATCELPFLGTKKTKPAEFYPHIVKAAPTSKTRLALIVQTTRMLSNNPRGVRLSHMNIMNRLSWAWNGLPYVKGGSCCLTDAITTAQSVTEIFGPLLKGVPLYVLKREDVRVMPTFINILCEFKISRVCFTPIQFVDFLTECTKLKDGNAALKEKLKLLKYIICRGQLLSRKNVVRFLTVFPKGKFLYSLYGHPELTGDLICEKYKSAKDVDKKTLLGRLLVGQTIQNTRIYILNSDFALLKEGEQGQICVSGLSVAMGYVDDASDVGNFIPNPLNNVGALLHHSDHGELFCTGDFGRMVRGNDRQLRLRIEGRADGLIHHKDHDFTVDDIRTAVLQIKEVSDVYILIVHPGEYEQNVVAFVVVKKEFMDTLQAGDYMYFQLSTDYELRNTLPEFMLPEVRLLNHIPVVETGRVDASDLLQQYEAGRDPGFTDWDLLEINDNNQKIAAQILLLGLYKFCCIPMEISIACMNSSAYDLGCDSNTTVSLFLYIVAKEYPITLQDFMAHNRLYDLVQVMEDKRQARMKRGKHTVSATTFQDLGLKSDYSTQPLDNRHRRSAIELLATCYTEKGDLERYNMVTYDEYVKFLQGCWDNLVKQKLCVCCVRNWDFKVVGVAVSVDFFTDLNIAKTTGALHHAMEFKHDIKAQFLHEIPHEVNNTLECFLMGTSKEATSKENVKIVTLLLAALRNTAEARNFANIYLTTSNQFVEGMCHYMMNYIILDQYAARQYVDPNGSRPFLLAPNTVGVTALLFNISSDFSQTDSKVIAEPEAGTGAAPTTVADIFTGKPSVKRRETSTELIELRDRIFR